MTSLEARNRRFLTDLFAGPFRGHGIIVCASSEDPDHLGDFTISSRPVSDWVPMHLAQYRARVRSLETLQDDAVPYVSLGTNTGLFAAAFGCPIHVYEGLETNAAARPIVRTASEADRLAIPSLDAPGLARVFELARLLRRELGPDVPISVPDIQSPFDVAALIWNKEDFYLAVIDDPEAVKRLVGKCGDLLVRFLTTFAREVGEVNFCHCPYAWAPPRLGCWLSEDEAGCLSPRMFDEFCMPWLLDLSAKFGGLFMHCCAAADPHYGSFRRIPNLRGLNRVFQAPGAGPAIEAFAGRTVLVQAWSDDDFMARMLDLARPESRFLFNIDPGPEADVMARYELLRARCPRP